VPWIDDTFNNTSSSSAAASTGEGSSEMVSSDENEQSPEVKQELRLYQGRIRDMRHELNELLTHQSRDRGRHNREDAEKSGRQMVTRSGRTHGKYGPNLGS
jgi:TolA-binding protein